MTIYDDHVDTWCDQHAVNRNDCGCQTQTQQLLAAIKSGTWLNEQHFPPLTYAIPHIIPEGYSVLAGAPKIGKSWLILETALALSFGGTALNHIPVEAGRVLYLALEDGDRRLQSRTGMLRPAQPLTELFNYATSIAPGQIQNTIKEWLNVYPDTRLIILDTLGKVMPPALKNETTYERDYRVGSSLKRIADEHPGLAIIAIHHDRKSKTGDFVDSVSGTNGVAGSADTIITLQRDRLNPQGILSVTGRDVTEAQYAITLRNNCQWMIDGNTLDESQKIAATRRTEIKTSNLGPDQQRILDLVKQHGPGIAPKHVAEALDWDNGKASAYLGRLADAGLIDKLARGTYGPL